MMDFTFLVQDMIRVLISKLKYIVLGALIMAVICAAAGYLKASSGGDAVSSEEQSALSEEYQKSSENYNYWSENQDQWQFEMEEDLTQLLKQQSENPVMKMDPNNCRYAELYTRFDDPQTDWRLTVNSWIFKEKPEKLFETDDESTIRYFGYLLGTEGERGGTKVIVYDYETYDYKNVLKNVKKLIEDGAKKNGVRITYMAETENSGFAGGIQGAQNGIKDNVNRAHNELTTFSNYGKTVSAPVAPASGGVSMKTLLKYMILGLILGACIVIFLILFPILKNGYIISKEQVEEMFPLDFLGDLSGNDAVAVEFAEANLETIAEGERSILILDFGKEELGKQAVDQLRADSDHDFLRGRDLTSDTNTIKAVKDVKDIVFGINMGHTMAQDIQKAMVRAHRLDKNILGYVVI